MVAMLTSIYLFFVELDISTLAESLSKLDCTAVL